VNVIVGAQLIYAGNPNFLEWAGIILIASGTFIMTLFGYKVVHMYGMFSWIPCFVVFLIAIGVSAKSGDFENNPMGSGPCEEGSIVSFAGAILGFATGWTSYVNTSRLRVLLWVFCGLFFSLCFTESKPSCILVSLQSNQILVLGVAVATTTKSHPAYALAYETDHVGGLLAEVAFPKDGDHGVGTFGKFCLIILALSIVLLAQLFTPNHDSRCSEGSSFLVDLRRNSRLLRHCDPRILPV
jgi:purine-cytosine permease-like protein